MKRLIIPATLGLSLAVLPLSVVMAVSHATTKATATPTPVATATPVPTPASNLPTPTPVAGTLSATDQAAHLTVLKTRGAAEINRRITSLKSSLTSLNATTKLSSTDKTTLTTQINTELTGLQTLATKLAADTTIAAARTDVQSIFDDYRVYALMLPKVRLVVADDNFVAVGTTFNTLANSLQDKINAAKTKGQDTTAVQATLADMELKLDDAKTKYTGLADKVINLNPSDYNANHALLTTDRDDLVAARADFTAARADVTTVVNFLNNKTTPSPSASPTATPVTTVNK